MSAIPAAYLDQMKTLAATVDELLNEPSKPRANGFVLLVFPASVEPDVQNVNYISNLPKAERYKMVKALRAVASRLDPDTQ